MIYLGLNEVNNLLPLSNCNKGCWAECYNYNDGVLKIYYDDIHPDILKNINNNIKKNSNIIMYPKDKLYVDFKLKGYYCLKAPGISLEELSNDIINGFKDLLFDDFLGMYYDKFLPEIIKENVVFDDLKLEHTFIDDNFYFIDTDFYKEKENNISNKSVKERNLSNINFFIFNYFIYSFTNENLYIPNNYKENYMEKMINNIRIKSNNYVDSFSKLNNYKF